MTDTPPNSEHGSLLIVEDGADNRRLLRQVLEPLGFVVREAENGAEGVEAWRHWQPHLIWMDMRMPVLDGFEATREIGKREQSLVARKWWSVSRK